MKKLILCVCILIFVGMFSFVLQGRFLYYGMTLSVEEFSELRTAIETSDEAQFSEIIQNLPNPSYIPRNLDEGRRFLELIDSYYLLDFSDRTEKVVTIHAAYDSLSEIVESLRVGFSFQGFSVSVHAKNENDYHVGEDDEVSFSLETSEGEAIAFYRNIGSYEYMAFVKNSATELVVAINVYDDAIDEATLLSLLGETPLNYCTVRGLTSDYEDDFSDVVFVDKPDTVQLLLWLALPVGVVAVVGGAAAVILLRRKKKPAPRGG